jgi:hypothetical protein
LEQWAASRDAAIERIEGSNSWNVDVATGSEEEALASLRAESWVLDARRVGAGAGPEDAMVDFPLGTVINTSSGQSTISENLQTTLRRVFGKCIGADNVFPRRGLEYEWRVLCPVPALFPGIGKTVPALANRWLKSKVIFKVYQTGVYEGPTSDRVLIEVPDGFLPTWSENESEPPPDNHTNEFHLTPEGTTRDKNFFTLVLLQAVAAKQLGNEWHGQAYIPDFFE